jgi:hypothetical protein
MSAHEKMRPGKKLAAAAMAGLIGAGVAGVAQATPYSSNVSISGNTVSFILNEPADSLTVSINGGAPLVLDGSTKGTKSFNIGSPSDKFSIVATKNDPVGYSIPTGGTTPAPAANGLSQTANNGGFQLISDDTNVFSRYNSPRGVTSQLNPNLPTFGTSYISNSAAGTIAASGALPSRTLGDGLYGIHADQSDGFGYGNTAKPAPETSASSSTPFRIAAGNDGSVYIADFADANSFVSRSSADLNTNQQILAGSTGPSTLPPGQNHGSLTAIFGATGPSGLTLYTLDEDLTTAQVTGTGSTTDKNSLWRYDIGNASLPYSGMPTKVNQSNVLVPAATSDFELGNNGKYYLAQNRSAGNEAGLVVLNADGSTAFDSLTASRTLLGNPTAVDIVRNVLGMAVSPDSKYVAVLLNDSDVAVMPLDSNGLPQLANLLLVDTGTDVISGRDIAFDAADNILYVSSGQGLLRTLSPGGLTSYELSYDGTAPVGSQYSFAAVPEPTSLAALAAAGSLTLLGRRRRRLA